MFSILRHILLFLVAGWLLASCASDAPEKPLPGSEVTFAVSDLTRASTTTTFDKFGVYGDMKLSDNAPVIVFNKTEVTKKDGNWSYQGTQYWFPNHEHSFVAVHPLSVLDGAQYADSKLTFTYTLPDSNDEAADIMSATHRRLYGENETNNVTTFEFSHLLSQINFSLELTEPSTRSDESFKIHKLEMEGFGTSASINIKPATLLSNKQTNDSEIDIVTAKGNGSLTVTFDEPIEVINGGDAVRMFGGDEALIMLPQIFQGDDKVQIRLTYSANDETETTEVSATLSGFEWESGKSYNYKIRLELEEPKEVNMVISGATILPWNLIYDEDDIVDAR